MSKVMRFSRPDLAAWRAAPTTPAAGPEKSAVMALRRIAVAGRRPPFDCITVRCPLNPESPSFCSNLPR